MGWALVSPLRYCMLLGQAGKPVQRRIATEPTAKTLQKSHETPNVFLSTDFCKAQGVVESLYLMRTLDLIRVFILPAERQKKKRIFPMCFYRKSIST